MRIAIVGDLQYEPPERLDALTADLNALCPTYMILLGDYGRWDTYGSVNAFSEVAGFLKALHCKNVVPLLGNHDLQYEMGGWKYPHGTLAANYAAAFGQMPRNHDLYCNGVRVLCLQLECPPDATCYCKYECYLSPESKQQLEEQLEGHPDIPTILITHAPPAGSRIITDPAVHLRASNAYLDQDHDYGWWQALAKKHRQIIAWFNGHYHFGHHHSNSHTIQDGLHYFTTGCPTNASRDGQKHSRILEVKPKELSVYTFDHTTHRLDEQPDAILPLSVPRATPAEEPAAFAVGCGVPVADGLRCGANGRIYIQTENGFLWEVDPVAKITTGTLHYSRLYTLDRFVVDREHVWRICGEQMFGHRYDDPRRFMREYDTPDCRYITRPTASLAQYQPCIHSDGAHYAKGRIWCPIDAHTIGTVFIENNILYYEPIRTEENA